MISKLMDAGALLGLTAIGQADLNANGMLDAAGKFGVAAVVVVFVLVRDQKREGALSARLSEVENSRVKLFQDVIEKNTQAITELRNHCTAATRQQGDR